MEMRATIENEMLAERLLRALAVSATVFGFLGITYWRTTAG